MEGLVSFFSLPEPHSLLLSSLQPSSSRSFCSPHSPLVHQLCCPLVAPIRGNSHSTFLLFAVLDARGSRCCSGVDQPLGQVFPDDAVSPSPAAPLCWAFCLPPREPVGPVGLCVQGLGRSCSELVLLGVVARRQPGRSSAADLLLWGWVKRGRWVPRLGPESCVASVSPTLGLGSTWPVIPQLWACALGS